MLLCVASNKAETMPSNREFPTLKPKMQKPLLQNEFLSSD
jgi:hypothetical protein